MKRHEIKEGRLYEGKRGGRRRVLRISAPNVARPHWSHGVKVEYVDLEQPDRTRTLSFVSFQRWAVREVRQ